MTIDATKGRRARARSMLGATLALLGLVAAGQACAQVDVARRNAAELLPGLPQQVVDDACREGAVTLYNAIYRNGGTGIVDQFKKRFPCVAVSTFVGTGGTITQRFTSESRAGNSPADIVMNASPSFGDSMVADGMLMHWTPPNADRVPAQWRHDGYWYAVAVEELGVAWNTEALSPSQKEWVTTLKRWDQLPSAPFKGAAALVDIRAGGSAQLPFAFFRSQFGDEYLKRLAALKPTVFNGINPLVERLAAGEFDLCLVGLSSTFTTQKVQGAPLAWVIPEPGLAFPNFAAIPARAPHPNAAKLYLAWSLTEEGQTAWITRTGLSPANPEVKIPNTPGEPTPAPAPASFYKPDWQAIAASLPANTALFTSIFGH